MKDFVRLAKGSIRVSVISISSVAGSNSLSLNVSYRQVRDSQLVETLMRILRDNELEPATLEIEITETS